MEEPGVEPADVEEAPASEQQPASEGAQKRRRGQREAHRAQYWLIVSSPENWKRTREHHFSIQGLKSRHRRRAESIRAGDRLLYYITGRMAFATTATVTSNVYEDHHLIWRTSRRDEDYPWRLHIRADLVLEESEWVPAKEVAYRLEYVRKWPPEHWTLAFQGQLHQLAQKDFKLIEDEIARVQSRRTASA